MVLLSSKLENGKREWRRNSTRHGISYLERLYRISKKGYVFPQNAPDSALKKTYLVVIAVIATIILIAILSILSLDFWIVPSASSGITVCTSHGTEVDGILLGSVRTLTSDNSTILYTSYSTEFVTATFTVYSTITWVGTAPCS